MSIPLPPPVLIDDTPPDQNLFQNDSTGGSLQDNFRKFRDQKKKERHIMKLARNGEFNGSGERTDHYKDALREKFIDAAKKYIGVPYAERFKADDVPVAPLYLDCCALVRRAVTDLQDEFGIILAKWNQAYQMDTLPIVLQESELRPGDLIFYEGLYNSKRSKSQKHNNVHVEIFLGGETGEATIGSRYHKGKVSIFPSYKFTSTTWSLVQYHFRSLDTWLNGECKSHCPEHRWHSDMLGIEAAAGRRSIFNDGSDNETAGGESDCDNDEDVCEMASSSEADNCNNANCSQTALNSEESKESKESEIVTECSAAEVDSISDRENRPQLNDASPQKKPPKGLATRSKSPSVSNMSGRNIKGTLGKYPQQRPKSAELASPSESPTKSLGGSGSLPVVGAMGAIGKRGGVAREGLGLVSGSAVQLQKRSMSLSTDTPVDSKSSSSATSASAGREKSNVPFTYYVGKSNGWRLLKDALDKRGWQQLPFEYSFSSRFNLKWVERRSQIDYRAHTPGQLVNHIPNNDCISTKLGLLSTLREKYCRVSSGSVIRKKTPWLPETYQLNSPADVIAVFEVESQLIKDRAQTAVTVSSEDNDKDKEDYLQFEKVKECALSSTSTSSTNTSSVTVESEEEPFTASAAVSGEESGCLWIYKPSCNNRGRGIKVLRGKEALELVCYGRPSIDPLTAIPPCQGILQRYVENPLLVGAEGLKFDVRCYMLVARNDPYMVYYHPGYCRLSLKRYSTSILSLDDPTVHLTNASVQKKDQLYEMNKELQIQSISDVADKIGANGDAEGASYLRDNMDEDIMQCMVDVLKAAMPKLIRKKGYFDLFGFDFMVSTASNRGDKLLLLEVNTNPALSLDNSTLANLLPGVVDGTVELVLKTQGPEGGLLGGAIGPTRSGSEKSNCSIISPICAPNEEGLPGGFRLLYDESAGYEFKSSVKRERRNSSTSPNRSSSSNIK